MLTEGLGSISFCNMSAAAGIGATSISTIEGTLRNSRFYDSKYPIEINWIIVNLRLFMLWNSSSSIFHYNFNILDWYHLTGTWNVWKRIYMITTYRTIQILHC